MKDMILWTVGLLSLSAGLGFLVAFVLLTVIQAVTATFELGRQVWELLVTKKMRWADRYAEPGAAWLCAFTGGGLFTLGRVGSDVAALLLLAVGASVVCAGLVAL